MAEVSIIVPVYQVEQYIRQCVDSILAQTFTDFELILVDDGSKDQSGKICDEYARMDARVKVIHQNNSGVAVARNNGIAYSNGRYLCFVDADDWIEDTMIAKCVSQIKEYGADVLRHGHIMELWKDGKCVNKEIKNAPNFVKVLTHDQIAKKMEKFWPNCSNYVWNYFFKREAIGQIQFPEIQISEDHVFVLEVLENCRRICFLSEDSYHYCMRMGSSANRWQETGICCQLEMIRTCHNFMDSFGIKAERKKSLMSNNILSAYSYAIYLLCFPECKWSVKEKMAKISEVRKELEIDQYTSYSVLTGLSIADKIKQQLICWRQEKLLILLGPIFMKVVRKANG
ncbi:glycosyltransferase family 2 protein [Sporofaciens sp. SGI.106]|uniref:glycosyltransferase family 2 protein n=1 Tax=Sporofaciens sp. SGI.106 TaxID=3420568 RepID=UPI003D060C86